jgi:hypothetical protein
MKTRLQVIVMAVLLTATASAVFAGGPLIIFDEATRTPYAYPGPVAVYTDLGSNGILSGAVSDANTAFGFAQWTGVASSSFSAAVAGDFSAVGLPDITGANAGVVVGTFNGGGIHVMYDHDGTITSNFFGAPPGVLGIASPDFAVGGTPDLSESWAMINGSAADPGDAAGTTYAGVFTHEFGHSINLAHTQTNGAAGFFGDQIGPDACGTPYAGPLTLSDFETMYPFLDITPGSTGGFQATVDHLDDIASVSNVYPGAGWPSSFGTITGIVYGPDGSTELTGINVIARNVSNPFKGAVSALSGDYTQGALGPDGLFTLNGLVPGADYVLYIDEIVAGGFSTSPSSIPGDGNEEFWNAAESADPGVDAPCDYTLITAAAGVTATADVIVNGDPNNLNLGDDDFVQVSLPFAFPFCGVSYNSVYVGSNGFLTFGSGDTDFSESVVEFLNDQPRIAPLWDDLNPGSGGSITAMAVGADFVVTYSNVPEFPSAGANTFAVTLRADGSFDVEYGAVSALDGLTGRSIGGGAANPGEVDLTTAPQPIGPLATVVYELFSSADNDLDNELLAFAPCVIPDPAAIMVDPTEMTAFLKPDQMETQALTIRNLGDLDLNFTIATSDGAGSPAQGGVIPSLDLTGEGTEIVLDEARIAKLNQDNAASSPGKPEVSDYAVSLPHAFALALLNEGFNAGFPAGWTVVDNQANGVTWQVPAQGGGNYTGGTGSAAGANSDFVGPAEFDTELRTPLITGFGPNVVLSYKVNYQNFAAFDFLDVDVSVDGGTSWATVLSWNEDHGGFFGTPGVQVALNLDPFVAGYPSFMVRWHYYDPNAGDWDWYVHVDDVMIVSDEVFTPCGFATVVPDMGTVPGKSTTEVDVTFDATGYAPGTYECELIILSNASNQPRLVVPLEMIVAQVAHLDFKPGSCPNPFNADLYDWAEDGAHEAKGGVTSVALLGSDDFDVSDVDLSTIRLEGVSPLSIGGGIRVKDVGGPGGDEECACPERAKDGFDDLTMKFQSQAIATGIMRGSHRDVHGVTLIGQLLDGTWFCAEDCVTLVGNNGGEEEEIIPENTILGVATPNPFNPTTSINFSLAHTGPVDLSIFDVQGRLVTRLVGGVRGAGDHSVAWNASGVASGIYFYRLTAGSFSETRKLVLLK